MAKAIIQASIIEIKYSKAFYVSDYVYAEYPIFWWSYIYNGIFLVNV